MEKERKANAKGIQREREREEKRERHLLNSYRVTKKSLFSSLYHRSDSHSSLENNPKIIIDTRRVS